MDGIHLLSELSFHLIVVSNQAGIPLGRFTEEQMSAFNQGIRSLVEASGGRLDAFYYSPYLELKNMPPDSKLDDTMKPNPGMLFEAREHFSLDLFQSFVIGDKTSDIVAGQRAGCTTILVLTGKAGDEEDAIPCLPDYVVADLYGAAKLIQKLSVWKAMKPVTISSRYRVTIPREIREQFHLKPGQKLAFIPFNRSLRVVVIPSFEEARGVLKGMNTDDIREEMDEER